MNPLMFVYDLYGMDHLRLARDVAACGRVLCVIINLSRLRAVPSRQIESNTYPYKGSLAQFIYALRIKAAPNQTYSLSASLQYTVSHQD